MSCRHFPATLLVTLICWAITLPAVAQPVSATGSLDTDYTSAVDELTRTIDDELQRGILTAVSIALVDGQRVVMARGYGLADRASRRPATAETVYRVGSISKLFTALATMQLVEQGKLELDEPLPDVLPDFRMINPFTDANPITLRQLMCHRSGLVRESPVGGYLDGSQPSMAESVASLESCVLVNPPNTRTRYSNIGVTVVGRAVEQASGMGFEAYQRCRLLEPLGMEHSSWRVDERIEDQLATGYMRVADRQGGFFHRAAPKFELGTLPAGNLYSNAHDMAQFAKMLIARGRIGSAQIIRRETLAEMATPQLTGKDSGYGIGFYVDTYGDQQRVRHSGAVYGFSTSIMVLPDAQIAAIVLANEDIVSGCVRKLSERALDLMLHAKIGRPIPTIPATLDLSSEELAACTGVFESPGHWAELQIEDGRLMADVSGQPMTVRPVAHDRFELDGRFVHRGNLDIHRSEEGAVTGFQALGQTFQRVTSPSPPVPAAWQQYLGSYGPEFIPLVVSLRHGHLYAMTENMIDYRLTPVTATVFAMPEGLYADEYLVFQLDEDGAPHAVTLANMTLPRLQE